MYFKYACTYVCLLIYGGGAHKGKTLKSHQKKGCVYQSSLFWSHWNFQTMFEGDQDMGFHKTSLNLMVSDFGFAVLNWGPHNHIPRFPGHTGLLLDPRVFPRSRLNGPHLWCGIMVSIDLERSSKRLTSIFNSNTFTVNLTSSKFEKTCFCQSLFRVLPISKSKDTCFLIFRIFRSMAHGPMKALKARIEPVWTSGVLEPWEFTLLDVLYLKHKDSYILMYIDLCFGIPDIFFKPFLWIWQLPQNQWYIYILSLSLYGPVISGKHMHNLNLCPLGQHFGGNYYVSRFEAVSPHATCPHIS